MDISQTPTTESMKSLLDTLMDRSGQDRDFLYYLAGFTHFQETQGLLSQYGISVDSRGRVYNSQDNAVYVKILVSDVDRKMSKSVKNYLSEKGCPLYQNRIDMWSRQLNRYVDRYQPQHSRETLWEYNQNLDAYYEMRLEEEVQLYRHLNTVHCLVYPTTLNCAYHVERLLNHVRFVLCVPAEDKMPNVSFHRLWHYYQNPPYSLHKPIWILTKNDHTDFVREALESSDMQYHLLDSLTPQEILHDITSLVQRDIEANR